MIKANEISLSFGTEVIYDKASFTIMPNQKVGIVGVNGAGKTTLFRLLLGTLELDEGSLIVNEKHIGYLPQEIVLPDLDISVWDFIFSGRPIKELENKLNDIYIALGDDDSDHNKLLREAKHIQDDLDYFNQYGAEEELLELVDQMELDSELLERKLTTLSGGQKSKVAFAKLLFAKPQILLLDEPTNHLDAQTKSYVINYLKDFHGMFLVISHDIDFLNATVDRILLVDKVSHKTKIYVGDYKRFKRQYAQEMMLKEYRIEQQEAEIEKLQDIVERARQASATNHNLKRMGKSKEKLLNKKLANLETRD